MAIDLRPVTSRDDIEHNFAVLAAALSNITGEQIAAGTVPGLSDYMPRGGGAFSGPFAAPPGCTFAGAAVVTTASLASEAVAGAVRRAPAVAALGLAVSGAYSQAQVQAISDRFDALLAALRGAGLIT